MLDGTRIAAPLGLGQTLHQLLVLVLSQAGGQGVEVDEHSSRLVGLGILIQKY